MTNVIREPLTDSPLQRVLSLLLMAFVLNGCAPVRTVTVETGPYPEEEPEYYPGPAGFSIPPGHRPPPGECRIWFPDRPPGHQPPPGDCYELEYRVPPGAVLIRG